MRYTPNTIKLVRELHQGQLYEYYPLGYHVVLAPQVCSGRPTIKYTRHTP